MWNVILAYASQVLSKKLDIHVERQTGSSANVYIEAVESVNVQRCLVILEVR